MIIQFETAKLAKEKGFDLKTLYHYGETRSASGTELINPFGQLGQGYILKNYNSSNWNYEKYSAPIQSKLQTWLRDEYNIIVEPKLKTGRKEKTPLFYCSIYTKTYGNNQWGIFKTLSSTGLDETGEEIHKTIVDSFEGILEVGLIEALKLIDNE